MLSHLLFIFILNLIKAKDYFCSFSFTVGKQGTTFEEMLKYKLKTNVCIGTPPQCNILELDTETYISWLVNASTPQLIIKPTFNSNQSSTFIKQQDSEHFWRQEVKSGTIFNDLLTIGEIKLNASMVLAREVRVFNRQGVIGLQKELSDTHVSSLLTQLQDSKIIESDEFSFEYNSSTTGKVTFGYVNRKSNATLLFKVPFSTETLYPAYVVMGGRIGLNSDSKTKMGGAINIDETYGFIEAPKREKDIIKKNYKLNDEMCIEKESWFDKDIKTRSRVYYYYVCEKAFVEKNIGSYSDFSVQFNRKKEHVIILEKEALFKEYNTTHDIFMIVIKDGDTQNYDWILGAPILKKYKISFNLHKSNISFLMHKSENKNNQWMCIGFIILGFVIFGIFTIGIISSDYLIKDNTIRSIDENGKISLLSKDIDFKIPSRKLLN